MTGASGPGAWPGHEPLEAQMIVLGDLSEVPEGVTGLPFLTQLSARGAGAEPVARTAALLLEMPVELGPHGWKLADHPGVDSERSRALLREDVDALAIAGYGYAGPLTLQVVGPWTLAATLYLARGDRVLSDRGAVRALAESLAAGLVEHVRDVRAQVPGAELTVQVHEPLLGQVAAGVLPTFSGMSRLRPVDGPDLVGGLRPLLDTARSGGVTSVVHVGQAWVGIAPVVLAGADGFGMDLAPVDTGWNAAGWELVARAVERGTTFWAGLPPAAVSRCAGADVRGLADVVSVPWRRMGLLASGLSDVVVTGAGVDARGVAAGSPQDARSALGTIVRAAAILAERAAD